jgi:glycosyltransferase involved in cell wall biosynthesis
MTILFLTREYKHENLPPCGGTGNFMTSMAKALVDKGHEVYVFGINKTNIQFEDNGVKVSFGKNLFLKNPLLNLVRSISKKISFLEKLHYKVHEIEKKNIAKRLYIYIKKNNLSIDIIETHDFEGISLFLNSSIPYLIRCHGSYSVLGKYFGYKVEKGRLHCEREAFKRAKNIVSISKFSEKVNTELFGIQNFRLIYNGIDTDLFKPNDSSKVIPKSVFYFGNISLEKGANVALEAFLELQKNNPDSSLHFLGKETSYNNNLMNIINENQLESKVQFYGIQPTIKVIEILSLADIVVFSSKGESFGLALVEAMSLEKTVIAANLDAFKEIVLDGVNGYIVDSSAGFVKRIEYLFENPDIAHKLQENARKHIVTNFSLSKMVAETEAYYTEVINKKIN